MSSLLSSSMQTIYNRSEAAGVMAIAISGGLSAMAILIWLMTFRRQSRTYQLTHIFAYFISLMMANTLQAVGTLMNFSWVSHGSVHSGPLCSAQGGIKQAGNVGTALWSFMIALHLFNLLFLRWKSTRIGLIITLIGGWACVVVVVSVGPGFIQSAARGPYFGVSGVWCWITDEYPREQFFLEYFFEYLSNGFGFFLYVAVLLRVRGNLVTIDNKWHLQFVSGGNRWRLHIGRDAIDTAMLRVAAHMVWYPVAYGIILIPVSLSRLTEFAGHEVPFWAIVLTDIIFNLTGAVNVILVLLTTRLIPDTSNLPDFATRRKGIDSSSTEAMGYTPFILPPRDEENAGPAQWSHIKLTSPTESTRYLQPRRSPTFRDSISTISKDTSEDTHDTANEPIIGTAGSRFHERIGYF